MKQKRLQYSEGAMAEAIAAVKGGMPKNTAAKTYDVPRTTLHHKLTGKVKRTNWDVTNIVLGTRLSSH